MVYRKEEFTLERIGFILGLVQLVTNPPLLLRWVVLRPPPEPLATQRPCHPPPHRARQAQAGPPPEPPRQQPSLATAYRQPFAPELDQLPRPQGPQPLPLHHRQVPAATRSPLAAIAAWPFATAAASDAFAFRTSLRAGPAAGRFAAFGRRWRHTRRPSAPFAHCAQCRPALHH